MAENLFKQITRYIGSNIVLECNITREQEEKTKKAARRKIFYDDEHRSRSGFNGDSPSTYAAAEANIKALRASFADSGIKELREIPAKVDRERILNIRKLFEH